MKRPTRIQSPRPASHFPWHHLLVIVAGVVAYANSFSSPFVLDDLASIVDNQQIRHWPSLVDLVSPLANSTVAGRPVVQLSLAINYAFGGLDVRGYHLWNLAVHIACALLLLAIVRRTLNLPGIAEPLARRSAGIALAVALVWAVHPLNSEVVDYLVQRTESMMAMFYLLAIYAAIRGATAADRRFAWDVTAGVACALGMLTKESMVTAPLMIAAFDRVFLFDSFARALSSRRRLYLFATSSWLIFAAVAMTAPRAEVVGLSSGVSPWTYLLNQAPIIVHYLGLAVWPHALIAFYGWPQALTVADVLPSLALVAGLACLTGVAFLRWPRVAFLGLWFFVTLAPASSIVPVATEVGAERRMYLPLAAIVVLGVVAAVRIWDGVAARARWSSTAVARGVAVVALASVTVGLSASTLARNAEYASPLTLARTVVERRPTSIAHHILGQELALAGNHAQAIVELREAVHGDSKAKYLLGIELFTEQQWADAISELDGFVRTAGLPYRLVPHWLEPSRTEVINARTVIGRAAGRLQRWPDVMEQSRQILAIDRSNADGYGLAADASFAQGKSADAAAAYRQYLTLRPTDADALNRLGVALMQMNQPADALAAFRRAVDADTRHGEARRNLATALLDAGDAPDALVHARAAVALRPDDAIAHQLLGRALELQEKRDEAAGEYARALALDPANADARADLARVASSGSSRRPRP
jgi:tetratricopeptide (TPR) repeat protein